MASPSHVHIALLRGINVGGKNKLPMQKLAELFTGAGCKAVQTYIQSGNVVFVAAPQLAGRIGSLITARIAKACGLSVPVVTRTAGELREVPRRNPFLRDGADPKSLHVAFLAELPDPARVAALDTKRSPGDAFVVRGRDVYLHLPNGAGRSKLTNDYFDRTLETVSTIRNWNTVLELIALSRS